VSETLSTTRRYVVELTAMEVGGKKAIVIKATDRMSWLSRVAARAIVVFSWAVTFEHRISLDGHLDNLGRHWTPSTQYGGLTV